MKDNETLLAILRTDLVAFTQRCFAELNPSQPFNVLWQFEHFAYLAQQLREGGLRRLLVALPPRSLKSTFWSVVFPECPEDVQLGSIRGPEPRTVSGGPRVAWLVAGGVGLGGGGCGKDNCRLRGLQAVPLPPNAPGHPPSTGASGDRLNSRRRGRPGGAAAFRPVTESRLGHMELRGGATRAASSATTRASTNNARARRQWTGGTRRSAIRAADVGLPVATMCG